MSYVATAMVKKADSWTAHDVDLDDVEDIDGVIEASDVDDDADLVLLFVEEEDEYLAIVRIDDVDGDPRIFVSDGHAGDSFALPALLLSGAGAVFDPIDDDDDEEDDEAGALLHDSGPVGDAALLADLGTSERDLLRICEREGALPSDIVSAVAENGGFLGELELVRGA